MNDVEVTPYEHSVYVAPARSRAPTIAFALALLALSAVLFLFAFCSWFRTPDSIEVEVPERGSQRGRTSARSPREPPSTSPARLER